MNKKKNIISYFACNGIILCLLGAIIAIFAVRTNNFKTEYLASLETGYEDISLFQLEVRNRFFLFFAIDVGLLVIFPICQSLYLYISTKGLSPTRKKYEKIHILVWFFMFAFSIAGLTFYLDQFHDNVVKVFMYVIAPAGVLVTGYFGYKKVS